MEIEFRRTGERRYAVIVHRSDGSMLEMSPAPGYDPLMPHDLLHYVVERELGLRSGVFGQLANGGSAGTFRLVAGKNEGDREVARRRRQLEKHGARLLRQGRRDASESERATHVCHQEWRSRRAARGARSDRGGAATGGLPVDCLDRICARLDELSGKWERLGIGESLTVDWPCR